MDLDITAADVTKPFLESEQCLINMIGQVIMLF